jgi:superfamily II DNA/RNA helicase
MYDFPRNYVDYLHRAGRAGRAGKPGKVTGIFTQKQKFVAKYINYKYVQERLRHRMQANPAKPERSDQPSKKTGKSFKRQKHKSRRH